MRIIEAFIFAVHNIPIQVLVNLWSLFWCEVFLFWLIPFDLEFYPSRSTMLTHLWIWFHRNNINKYSVISFISYKESKPRVSVHYMISFSTLLNEIEKKQNIACSQAFHASVLTAIGVSTITPFTSDILTNRQVYISQDSNHLRIDIIHYKMTFV